MPSNTRYIADESLMRIVFRNSCIFVWENVERNYYKLKENCVNKGNIKENICYFQKT